MLARLAREATAIAIQIVALIADSARAVAARVIGDDALLNIHNSTIGNPATDATTIADRSRIVGQGAATNGQRASFAPDPATAAGLTVGTTGRVIGHGAIADRHCGI